MAWCKLIKTGQQTSFRTGDDGAIQAGRDVDFTTLDANNPFGNTNRFTDELGGSTYTNNIVIDWSTYDGSTVLGYYRVNNGSTLNWNDAIDGALAVSIGSFTTGWRLPNIFELTNINNYENSSVKNYSPFNLNLILWASTTSPASTGQALQSYTTGASNTVNKTNTATAQYIAVRTFTVTGTTLS